MWCDVLEKADNQLPCFNDYMIRDFRTKGIDQMVEYLDQNFKDTEGLFYGQLEYLSYRKLPPEEAVFQRFARLSSTEKKIPIHHTSRKLVEFKFRYFGTIRSMYLQLIYVEDGVCVWYDGKQYYPIFQLMERVIHVIPDANWVNIKLARAGLSFHKREWRSFTSMRGTVYREYMITCKLHQNTKRSKKEHTPVFLYHVVTHGFNEALKLYDIDPNDVMFTTKYKKEKGYVYFKFKIDEEGYLRVREPLLDNTKTLRVILAIWHIVKIYKKTSMSMWMRYTQDAFKIALGKYLEPNKSDRESLYHATNQHLHSYETLVDTMAIQQLNRMGWNCKSMSDLLMIANDNIDSWLLTELNNLGNKKVASLTPTIAPLIRKMSNEQYNCQGRSPKNIEPHRITRFLNKISGTNPKWFTPVCRAEPSVINNNWLISIGLKMDRSLTETETGVRSAGRSASDNKPPESAMVSHPSWLAVRSLINWPNSNPIMSGTLNPYLQIDGDGNITIPPKLEEETKNVFD